jgi:branched-chain amino acid transport system permease protein
MILASTYALLAAGIVIVYKASRVINFAHGEIAVVGGYLFYSIGMFAPGSLWLAIGGTMVFAIVTGVAIYLVLMRRLIGEPFYVAILVTVGIAILFKAAIIIVWRAERVTINVADQIVAILPGGAKFSTVDLATIMAAVLFYIGLFAFFRFTQLGLQFRGMAENPLLASQRRVSVNAIMALAWSIAVFAACLSGVLYGGRALLSPGSVAIGLSGLTAALVGGLDSLRGAALGAIVVALAEYSTIRLIDPVLSEAVPFILLLTVMNVRPWGLFGTREELDRV